MNWIGEAYLAAALHRDELHRPATPRVDPDEYAIHRLVSALRKTFAGKYCAYRGIAAQECFA